MKLNRMLCIVMSLTLLLCCSCGKTAAPKEETAAPASSAAAEEQTITGTVDEIKDFMFVLDAEDGEFYAFPYEKSNLPEGFEGVKEGDKITVHYEGELSVVDNFNGTILSVEKLS